MKILNFPVVPLILLMFLAGCNGASKSNDAQSNTEQSISPADIVLTNGRIYTLDKQSPWAEAVAIKGGKYSYVGTTAGVADFQGSETHTIDLQGRMAMPGINDAHSHPIWGGIKELYECSFPFSATPKQIAETVSACAEENPDAQWIIGGQWDSDLFVNHDITSPKGFLDKVSMDKAVILTSDSGHDAWVNTKALQMAGVTQQTEDPNGGVIVRDQNGLPNGLLLENAKKQVTDIVPEWSSAQYESGLKKAVQIANRFGITGLKEAWASREALAAAKALGDSNDITLHFATSIDVTYGLEDDAFDVKKILALSDQYAANHVDTRFVKIFMDGVPTSSRTAAMLDDYTPESEGGNSHNGSLHYPPDKLAELITALDSAGMTVKTHTAGDRSVRVTLDAIEQARKANGRSGLRHELAHAGYIDADDLPRFSALNAVADLSPYIWHPSPIMDSVLGAVGERGKHYWPIKTLLASGAHVLAGSDWPAAVPSMNPWVGIEAMVSRADPYSNSAGKLWQEEAISLPQALEIYTVSGAHALRQENVTGSIVPGKSADLIVLNQNLFDVAVQDISDTQVLMTLFEGDVVYESDE